MAYEEYILQNRDLNEKIFCEHPILGIKQLVQN